MTLTAFFFTLALGFSIGGLIEHVRHDRLEARLREAEDRADSLEALFKASTLVCVRYVASLGVMSHHVRWMSALLRAVSPHALLSKADHKDLDEGLKDAEDALMVYGASSDPDNLQRQVDEELRDALAELAREDA